MRLPWMLYAVVARCPVYRRRCCKLRLPRRLKPSRRSSCGADSEGWRVVADNTWPPWKVERHLTVQWNEGPNANLDSAGIRQILESCVATPGNVGKGKPVKVKRRWPQAAKQIEAVYERPTCAHAPMEPFTCVA
jgi:isoquinoline 1-oxidoreductase beta subunit